METTSHHNLITDLIDSKLSIGDQIRFKVVSNSMAPIIEAGDSVTACLSPPEKIKRGDIVVIRRDSDFLTHRAIKPDNHGWLTKGDNTALYDSPSKPKNILGNIVAAQKENQSVSFLTRKWTIFNPILAILGEQEAKAFVFHPFLRHPFRFGIRIIQKFII